MMGGVRRGRGGAQCIGEFDPLGFAKMMKIDGHVRNLHKLT